MLSPLEQVHDISLTTNGYLLRRQVSDLVRAGLRRINVSLDSLAPDRFFQLTRRNSLAEVLDGLAAAQEHPELRPIKVNVVALRDFTEAEVVRFAEFARSEPYEVRFIEFMPLDADQKWDRDRVLPNEEIRAMIDAVHPLEPQGRERHSTARRWRFADGRGEIGFISPVSEPFCGDCNRIRITAEGMLRTCLFSMNETDLRAPLRAGASDAESSRSSATRCGTRSSSTTSTTPASCSPRARCRGSGDDLGSDPPRARSRGRGSAGGLSQVLDVEDALALVLEAARPLAAERVGLEEAAGRVVAEDARSAVDLPPFDRSAMDGFAVRAADTAEQRPLRIAGAVQAGQVGEPLEPATAVQINTGAAIPPAPTPCSRSSSRRSTTAT